jgi:rRNA processing protein Krr1/Pno1
MYIYALVSGELILYVGKSKHLKLIEEIFEELINIKSENGNVYNTLYRKRSNLKG